MQDLEEQLEKLKERTTRTPLSEQKDLGASKTSFIAKREEEIRIERLEEDVRGKKQDREERKRYAELVYDLIYHYFIALFLLLFACGANIIHLDKEVLIALIATLAVEIIGAFIVILKYLYPSMNKKE